VSGLGDWEIIKLDGGKIVGAGYGGKVTYYSQVSIGWMFVVPMSYTWLIPAVDKGGNPTNLGECEGDCDDDSDCIGTLVCSHRNGWDDPLPPGCSGSPHAESHDYCYDPAKALIPAVDKGDNPTNLGECEGDCDRDSDCIGALVCGHRNGWDDALPPGCSGTPHYESHDYCYDPAKGSFAALAVMSAKDGGADAALGAASFAYIGCYADSSARALPISRGDGYSLGSCLSACSDFPYFGLQFNGQCWCGESYADATQYGESTKCPTSRLGAAWANDLYRNYAVSVGEYEMLYINSMTEIPDGWRWMTVEEAAARKDELVSGLEDWAIIKLDGGKIEGSGYGGKVTYYSQVVFGWVFVVPMYEGAAQSPLFVKEQPYEFKHPPQKSMPNTQPKHDNVFKKPDERVFKKLVVPVHAPPRNYAPHSTPPQTVLVDLSSLTSRWVIGASMLCVAVLLVMNLVRMARTRSDGRRRYSKVAYVDSEFTDHEAQAINVNAEK